MIYLLDTDTCIFLIRKKSPEIFERLQTLKPGDICVSAITVAELQFGVAKSQSPLKNGQALEAFLAPFVLLPFHAYVALSYGHIRAHLAKAGTPIGPLDTLIAAHALHEDLTLVSNNTREFLRVPGLKLTNWLKSTESR